MRIIERKEPEFEYVCPYCKSKLGISKSDIKGKNVKDYGGGSEYMITAVCMVCSSTFQIDEKAVPYAWRPSAS